MKSYAPYLLYQVARFGALTVPQILQVCEGKCRRSSLYRALGELVDGDFVYPILNPASRTRAYYATPDGRQQVFGTEQPLTAGVKPAELDHTITCADVLMKLCKFENVTGVATHFELSQEDFKRFCHERIPDGIIQLTQEGQSYELAVEVETSNRNASRVEQVLSHYWDTFRKGYECSGLLLIAVTRPIATMYRTALAQMPEEFQNRVRLLEGTDLQGLNQEAFGSPTANLSRCLDLARTSFHDEIKYSSTKSEIYLSQNLPKPRKDEDVHDEVL